MRNKIRRGAVPRTFSIGADQNEFLKTISNPSEWIRDVIDKEMLVPLTEFQRNALKILYDGCGIDEPNNLSKFARHNGLIVTKVQCEDFLNEHMRSKS